MDEDFGSECVHILDEFVSRYNMEWVNQPNSVPDTFNEGTFIKKLALVFTKWYFHRQEFSPTDQKVWPTYLTEGRGGETKNKIEN